MSVISGSLAETVTTRLSLAVYLTDDYSGRGGYLDGDVTVSLKGQKTESFRNPGGYYLFLDLPEGSYTVQINGGEYYFDKEKEDVTPADLKKKSPVINITLKPTPSYPFQSSATLIRGFVKDPEGRGIPGAVIRVRKTKIKTWTNDSGEFVIYFKNLKKDDVTTVGGKKLVKINGKNPVLKISHPDYKKKSKTVKVEEGKTKSISITYH